MPASTFTGNALLNLYLRGVAITPPTGVWVALHTDDPGGTGTDEVSTSDWPAYERLEAAQGGAIATGFAAASNKATNNLLELLYPAHDGSEAVTVTHVGFWDAETGGNFLLSGTLVDTNGDPTTKTYSPSDEAVIHADEISVTVA